MAELWEDPVPEKPIRGSNVVPWSVTITILLAEIATVAYFTFA